MKFRRMDESQVNRPARGADVLRVPEQPICTPWNPKDEELFARLFQSTEQLAETDLSQRAYALFDLDVIHLGRAVDRHKEEVVEVLVEAMQNELLNWISRPEEDGDWILGMFSRFILPTLLLKPNFQLEAPKSFWDFVHNSMQERKWHRDFLRVYSLLFPDRMQGYKTEVVTTLKGAIKDTKGSSGVNGGHDLVAGFATLRMVDPEMFSESGMTEGDREEARRFLTESRKDDIERLQRIGPYPEELFLGMVALADEVSFSKEKGLQVKFSRPKGVDSPGLPERPQV